MASFIASAMEQGERDDMVGPRDARSDGGQVNDGLPQNVWLLHEAFRACVRDLALNPTVIVRRGNEASLPRCALPSG